MPSKIEKDAVTGTDTTGHEWDGIRELNTPLPSWWVITFWVTILWSVGYWVVYPSWPGLNGYLTGLFGTTNRTELHQSMEALRAERAVFTDRIAALEVTGVAADAELFAFSQAGAKGYFADNCAPCHGTNGVGNVGYPSLLDDDWLWGGDLEAIQTTLLYGIRADHDETRLSEMPAFGRDELLETDEIGDVVQYVLSLSGRGEEAAAAARGAEIFVDNCESCHGEGGVGLQELGAPNLADAIWLYGGSKADITEMVMNSRAGVMPYFEDRLTDAQIKMLAVYVHSLGGGQ